MSEDVKKPKRRKPRGFAALTEEELRNVSARGGASTWAQGKAHVFTRHSARQASFARKGIDPSNVPLPMRKGVTGRYEYQVEVEVNGEKKKKWVSRQMVYLLRRKQKQQDT